MKTSFYLTAFCLVSISIFLFCAKLTNNTGNISITVNENDDAYKLTASFDPAATTRVLHYINSSIRGTGGSYFDETTRRIDVTTRLGDNTEFYIKESAGELKIKLDKRKNSYASYMRIKRMCEGIKNVLAGKQENLK
ncbi:MAG: hypothetical protein M3N14_00475 [Bacteroidota bacterium]|nr:hypothetical protein [Bacteroidota bacterium]